MAKYTEKDDWKYDETEEPEDQEQDVITYKINYYPSDFTLNGYLEKWDNKQLIIPPFQRQYIWSRVDASKLIESCLLGLPIPGVFLYQERNTKKLLIIDGQQRIRSIINFYKNAFGEMKFRLKNVHPKWVNKSIDDLDPADRNQLDDTVLRATVIQQLDPEDDTSIYHVFERLNTGGVNLNPMEIRRCVYQGSFIQALEEMNEAPAWRKIIGRPKLDKRFRDVELILRIIALREKWKDYEKPMKSFLTNYIIDNKTMNEKMISKLKADFNKTCDYVLKKLGDKPFHVRKRLNYAVLDSIMTIAFKACNKDETNFKKKFNSLLKNEVYYKNITISTSDDASVESRFKLANKYLIK